MNIVVQMSLLCSISQLLNNSNAICYPVWKNALVQLALTHRQQVTACYKSVNLMNWHERGLSLEQYRLFMGSKRICAFLQSQWHFHYFHWLICSIVITFSYMIKHLWSLIQHSPLSLLLRKSHSGKRQGWVVKCSALQ